MIDVIVVRIYINESSHLSNKIAKYLKNDVKIRGFSVFRAIEGYGESGSHSANLLDLSLNLPLTIEFFDHDKEKIGKAMDYLNTVVKPQHVITWDAKANE